MPEGTCWVLYLQVLHHRNQLYLVEYSLVPGERYCFFTTLTAKLFPWSNHVRKGEQTKLLSGARTYHMLSLHTQAMGPSSSVILSALTWQWLSRASGRRRSFLTPLHVY